MASTLTGFLTSVSCADAVLKIAEDDDDDDAILVSRFFHVSERDFKQEMRLQEAFS